MKAMDGKTTIPQLIDLIGEEWEVEMDEDQVNRFAERLSERYLLDIASYDTDDKATTKEIKKRLEKSGFLFRVEARDASNPEASLFALGMRHATGDSPLQAASYFQAILEINPNNTRARLVLDCIHDAFLTMRRKDMAHGAKSMPLVNPDEFLGKVDKRLGNFIFSWPGAFVILLICLAQIPMFIDLLSMPEFQPSAFAWIDVVSFIVVALLIMLIHELGHALACKHYGGHPTELGLQLILGVLPAAYCDASDTYLFKESRHKVICFMSGIPAQLAGSTVVFAVLLLTDPSTPGWLGAALAVMYGVVTVYQNLNPLIPFDGYYALGDHLGIINLRERSFDYVWHALAKSIFGVTSDEYENTEDDERFALLVFGSLAMSYTLFWLVLIMLNFFVPLAIEHLGMIGLILVSAYLYGQLKLVTRTLVFPFIRFLRTNRKQVFGFRRSMAYLFVIAGITWVLNISGHVHVDGQMVIESTEVASIVVREPGVIGEVLAEEGLMVESGQPLFRLHSEQLEREFSQAEPAVAMAELQLKMLESGARPEQIALVLASHRANRARSSLMSSKLKQARSLQALEVTSRASVLEARSDAVRASGDSRISSAGIQVVEAGNSENDIAKARAQLKKVQADLAALIERREALTIRARIAGRVVSRDLGMLLGRWVPEGEMIGQLERADAWRIRVRPGLAEPIAGLASGDKVALRAYGFPHEEVVVRVAKLLPPSNDETESIVIETTSTQNDKWRSGLSGRARIYGPKRSLAYRYVALPVVQLFNVRIVPMFTGV
jgi:putative peptide zinc metalloprotease protein